MLKFPNQILREGEKKPSINNFNDPLDVCVVQEVERFNNLIRHMEASLEILVKAVKGEAVMNDDLEMMFNSFLNNQVPGLWKKHAYPSLKNFSDWYKDFIERINFFRSWYTKGERPFYYMLNYFFFPQGFLTSVLQDHSRLEGIAINRLSFMFDFKNADSSSLTAGPETGCYISGLVMEGARFDGTKANLIPNEIDSPMYEEAPLIHFKPTRDYIPNPADYAMPLYKTV